MNASLRFWINSEGECGRSYVDGNGDEQDDDIAGSLAVEDVAHWREKPVEAVTHADFEAEFDRLNRTLMTPVEYALYARWKHVAVILADADFEGRVYANLDYGNGLPGRVLLTIEPILDAGLADALRARLDRFEGAYVDIMFENDAFKVGQFQYDTLIRVSDDLDDAGVLDLARRYQTAIYAEEVTA